MKCVLYNTYDKAAGVSASMHVGVDNSIRDRKYYLGKVKTYCISEASADAGYHQTCMGLSCKQGGYTTEEELAGSLRYVEKMPLWQPQRQNMSTTLKVPGCNPQLNRSR